MILITDVATKLQELLNSYNPSDYSFVVKSAGYHLDKISNQSKSRNEIPVFVGQIGGEYNPVPNLHQINFTYEATIWFPVRFKEDFYNLNVSLEQWFVGKKVSFGSETALCNISVAEYGEIVGIQVEEFANWVAEQYEGSVHLFKKEEEINEPYMSMNFRLFCTTLGEGFMFGNDVKYTLTVVAPGLIVGAIKLKYTTLNDFAVYTRDDDDDTQDKYAWKNTITELLIYSDTLPTDAHPFTENTKFYTYNEDNQTYTEITDKKYYGVESFDLHGTQVLIEDLVWDSSGTGASISPISEQLVGVDKYVKNISNITNFNKSIVAYVKETSLWKTILVFYNQQMLDRLQITLTKIFKLGNVLYSHDHKQIILSYNENIELGNPLSFTLTFGD